MTDEHKNILKQSAARRSEQLQQAKDNALKIGKYSVWPIEDDYWVLCETNSAGNEGEYRYYPALDHALHKILNGQLADSVRKGVKNLHTALQQSEATITASVTQRRLL